MTRWTGRDDLNLVEAFELARELVRSCLVINGGAAVAILAFFGQALAAGQVSPDSRRALGAALVWFASGVGLSAITFCLGYFVQFFWGRSYSGETIEAALLTRERWQKAASVLQLIAIASTLASIVAFGGGSLAARRAVLSEPASPHLKYQIPVA